MPAQVIAREPTADEATLQQRAQRIVQTLIELGTTHATGLPDNATRWLYQLLQAEPRLQVVPVCREGEAWAVASGLWIGGGKPVVIMQNTGFLEAGDALRGTAIEMAVPLLAILSYRGYWSLASRDHDAVDSAARLLEPTLRAWQVPYHFLTDQREREILLAADQQAQQLRRPVAVLMT
jgi:sulfopyruvate decarboxylase TPP-binding subunit